MNVSLGAPSSPLPNSSMNWDIQAQIKQHDEESTMTIVGNIFILLKDEIGAVISEQKFNDLCKNLNRILKLVTIENFFLIFLTFWSMVGSLFVASMIFSSKKLQVHPNRLIGFTCLSEAISSFNGVIWTMGTSRFISYMDLN